MKLTFRLNGLLVSRDLIPHGDSISVLREVFDCRSLHTACQSIDCGTCLILVDGNPVLSCLLPVFDLRRRDVWTMEGISRQEGFADIVRGFEQSNAHPCHLCAPSRALLCEALLKKTLRPSREQLVVAAGSVRCDCTSTPRIIDAMRCAARQRAGRL